MCSSQQTEAQTDSQLTPIISMWAAMHVLILLTQTSFGSLWKIQILWVTVFLILLYFFPSSKGEFLVCNESKPTENQ